MDVPRDDGVDRGHILSGNPEERSFTGFSDLGLYVHIPYCSTTCDFCAFYQKRPTRSEVNSYIEGIHRESLFFSSIPIHPPTTVFFGGGTPGILSPGDLDKLRIALAPILDEVAPREWTVEMAPATVNPAKLRVLRDMGVNRISLGVQSFNSRTLESMGRQHRVTQIHRAYDWIREIGFRSVNIDMIIAFPGQTEEALFSDFESAISLDPDHLSAYCLTFEEDTPLYARLMKGQVKRSLENEALLYESTWSFLESHGMKQYEISNFSKPGHESIHNLNTWKMGEWIGLGPSASSQFLKRRWTQAHDIDQWLKLAGSDPFVSQVCAILTRNSLLSDCLIFGLRMNRGIGIPEMESRFGKGCLNLWESLFKNLVAEGLAVYDSGQRICLTLEGRLKADAIGVEILMNEAPEKFS